jgi:excisionase family DNA binding protein
MAHSGVYSRYVKSGKENLCDESILTVKEVSKMLKCSKAHVYNMINNGRLSTFQIGEKKGYRVYNRDVERIMAEQIEVE